MYKMRYWGIYLLQKRYARLNETAMLIFSP